MKKLEKNTQTAVNLMKSFAGETQASMRYAYYAKEARKEKLIQIANIFEETSRNEAEHAKRFYKFLNADLMDETIEITSSFPVHLGDTKSNLLAAAGGENEEHSDMYPEFARIAREEGYAEIADVFIEVGEVEEAHEKRFLKLHENLATGYLFKKDEVVLWKCNNCGYIHEGVEAPIVCPACDHPQGYFEVFVETY
ncbi:rubrerythrin [Anaerosphaera multitolerans]|uniref:Rubrerythrin family protein n=1 Tax=Anaerosphaera multitolerans TaxID=2487351 RepID=A0A437S5J6_9FIRM|nr:rubrerythrin family protein [Anaerosphaera multitolerans]RVU54258.1 rubrerythrin family protein [Anaerosphaera multitolerans]